MNNQKHMDVLVVFLIAISFIIGSIFLQTSRNNDITDDTHPNFSVTLAKSKSSTYYYYQDEYEDNSYLITNDTTYLNFESYFLNNDSFGQKTSCRDEIDYYNTSISNSKYYMMYCNNIFLNISFTDINLSVVRYNISHLEISYNSTLEYVNIHSDSFLIRFYIGYSSIQLYINTNDRQFYNVYSSLNFLNFLSINYSIYNVFYFNVFSSTPNYNVLNMQTSNTYLNIISANIIYYNVIDNTTYLDDRYKLSLTILGLINLGFSDVNVYIQQDSDIPYMFLSLYQKRVFTFSAECYCFLVNNWDITTLENYGYIININFEYYPNLMVV